MSTLLDYMQLKVTQEDTPGSQNQTGPCSATIKSQGTEPPESFLERIICHFRPQPAGCTNENARKTPYDYIHVRGLR